MIQKMIEEYVNRLSKDDVITFGIKNGIELNNKELDIVYNHIKQNWKTIIYGNPKPILEDIKQNTSPLTYQKIENLYTKFYEKYKNYL